MDEADAHRLYVQLRQTDAGAKQKKGLGFSAQPVEAASHRQAQDGAGKACLPGFAPAAGRQQAGSPHKAQQPSPDYKSTKCRRAEGREHRNHRSNRKRKDREHEGQHESPNPGSTGPARSHHSLERRSTQRLTRHLSRNRRGKEQRHESSDQHESRHRASSRHRDKTGHRHEDRQPLPRPPPQPQSTDYAAMIEGYESMKPSEKLKARTRLQLERNHCSKVHSRTGQDDTQWTRFVFNKDALLEEEGAQAEGGFSSGTNMLSLKSSQQSARSAHEIIAAHRSHEDAIFGRTPVNDGLAALQRDDYAERQLHVDSSTQSTDISPAEPVNENDMVDAIAIANQTNLSWRERAELMRARRRQA